MLLYDKLDEFLYQKKVEMCSPSTIANYNVIVRAFLDYISLLHPKSDDFKLDLLDLQVINTYILYLSTKKVSNHMHKSDKVLSKNSIHTYIRHLKVFLNYCKYPWVSEIKNVKRSRKVVKILTREEIVTIINYLNFKNVDYNDFYRYRDLTIFLLLLDCGMRKNELMNIKISDIDFEKRIINLRVTKNSDERLAKYSVKIAELLEKYIDSRSRYTNEYLFVNKFDNKINKNSIDNMFHRLYKNLDIKITSHILRHNFATKYLVYSKKQHGFYDIKSLQLLLGHADIETTENYIHLAERELLFENSYSVLDNVLLDL